MKLVKLGLACFVAGGAISLVSSPAALAFSFGGLAGIFGSFAPVLEDVLKTDLTNIVSQASIAAGVADSLQSGDFMEAAAGIGDSLGAAGAVDLQKYREKMLAGANYNANSDYGIGLYGEQTLSQSAGMEALAQTQNEANTSTQAQGSVVKKMEGMSKTLNAMVTQASSAAESNNSLTVMKTIPASLTALGGLVTQNTTAVMEVKNAVGQGNVYNAQVMTELLRSSRGNTRNGLGRVGQTARGLGLFLGLSEPRSGYSTTQLPSSVNLAP